VKKLLVIEDDIDTLYIIDVLFKESDFIVVKSEREISIQELLDLNPSVILIDYLLGHTFGDKLCLKIKTNLLTKHFPVILFSASLDLERIAHNSCADAYLAKPFNIADLLGLVNELAN